MRAVSHTLLVTRRESRGEATSGQSRAPAAVVGGRVLLAATAAMVLLARASQASWEKVSTDAGGVPSHWVPETTLVIAFVFALFAPALFLPVGSLGAARERGHRLEVQTVLGVRGLDLEGVRATRVLVPGRGHNLDVLVVRDAQWRVVIVTSPGSSSPEWSSTPRLRELWRGTSQRGSRAAAWLRGWVALMLWGCCALLLIGLVGGVAGIF